MASASDGGWQQNPSLEAAINLANKEFIKGPIAITDFSLGDEYPILKSARMRFAEHSSNLRAELSFAFDDQITIGIDTQVLINWPKPLIASLPVSLVLSVIKFSGTLALEFVTHPETAETYMAVSILEDFLLEFEVRSLLGHRTKVKDLPKLTSLITSRLRSLFMDEIVWPSFKRIHIPTTISSRRPSLFRNDLEDEAVAAAAIGTSPSPGLGGEIGRLNINVDDELQIGDSASVMGSSSGALGAGAKDTQDGLAPSTTPSLRVHVNGAGSGDSAIVGLSEGSTLAMPSASLGVSGLERRKSRPAAIVT
ncbi:ERMES complex subunit mmm1 [Dinochytrium kinnereticum]|nr:ERMES complex subunit mmm1 [Dinochytrium kinnereticum]